MPIPFPGPAGQPWAASTKVAGTMLHYSYHEWPAGQPGLCFFTFSFASCLSVSPRYLVPSSNQAFRVQPTPYHHDLMLLALGLAPGLPLLVAEEQRLRQELGDVHGTPRPPEMPSPLHNRQLCTGDPSR
eukprot:scaffold6226_cov117-Isochrysis_galbana.AAC.8